MLVNSIALCCFVVDKSSKCFCMHNDGWCFEVLGLGNWVFDLVLYISDTYLY